VLVLSEELVSVDARDDVDRDVRGLMFEPAMYIDIGIDAPTGMSESLERVELVPLT
jgi:hypothetical protein